MVRLLGRDGVCLGFLDRSSVLYFGGSGGGNGKKF